MASFLTDLKRKLGVQQPRQAWDERIPNGASPNDLLRVAQSSADVNGGQSPTPALQTPYSQNINPTVRPQQPAPTPRFLDNVRAAVNQPAPTPQPTLDQALMSGGPTQAEQPAQQQQAQPQGMQRNPYRDQLTQDEAQLRALEDKKDKFWKRAVIAGINAGQAGFGYQPTQIQTSRTRDIAKTQGRIARDMKILQDTGQIDAREAAILRGQGQLDLGAERNRIAGDRLNQQQGQFEQKQHNVRRAELIRRHAALTDFDPSDPKNAGFVDEWTQEFGNPPIKNVRGSQYGYRQGYDENGNVRAEVYNKGTGETKDVQGSSITSTEGQQNRAAANTRSANTISAANTRAAANIAARGQGQGRAGVSFDKTASRRAAKLAGEIETVRKALEAHDAISPAQKGADGSIVRAPEEEAIRKGIADRAAASITELNNLNAGYEAGMGTGGYPYSKKLGQESAPQAQGPYAGKKFNRAKIAERAKTLGMTPAQAEKQITDGGGIVY